MSDAQDRAWSGLAPVVTFDSTMNSFVSSVWGEAERGDFAPAFVCGHLPRLPGHSLPPLLPMLCVLGERTPRGALAYKAVLKAIC